MNIVFYFPYPTVGGVSILFLRLAEYFSKSYNIIIMDMHEGYMSKRLPSNCSFVPYNSPELLPSNSIIIMQSCPLWRIPKIKYFPTDTKFFFWNLHPDNLNPNIINDKTDQKKMFRKFVNLFNFSRKNKLSRQTNFFIDNNAIFFMDCENLNVTQNLLDISISEDLYLPIINNLSSPERLRLNPISIKEKIKCIWIGRIEGFKISILLYTIARLDALQSFNIHFTIVGSGSGQNDVKELLGSCNNITYSLIDYLPHDKLNETLEDMHLAFGMGTSALDSASIGLPTICLDYSYTQINNYYRFHYIYENKDFCLGYEIDSSTEQMFECNLESLINMLIYDGQIISDRCYNYCLKNHSMSTLENLPSLLLNSNVTIENIIREKFSTSDILTRILVFVLGRNKIDNSGFIFF